MLRSSIAALAFLSLLAPPSLWGQVQVDAGGQAPLRIYGLGDMGEPGPVLDRTVTILRDLIARESSADDSIVYLGDNFYPDGLQDKSKERVAALIHGVVDASGLRGVQAALKKGRVFAVPGNHEYYKMLLFGQLPLGFSEQGDATRRHAPDLGWRYAGGRSDVAYLEAPDGARVALFLLDSAIAVAGSQARSQAVMDELQELLKASADRADWRILVMHHPLVTRGNHGHSFDRSEEHSWIRRNTFPHKLDTCSKRFKGFAKRLDGVIDAAGVPIDAVLSGHDHNLQLIDLPARASLGPRIQIVSGAAAKVNGRARRLDANEFLDATPGLVELQLSRSVFRIVFHGGESPCLRGQGASTGFTAFQVVRGSTVAGEVGCSLK